MQPQRYCRILFALFLLFCASGALCQFGTDTTLFRIPLSADSSSLFYCGQPEDIAHSLSGPILMANKTLLFYSANGYALYENSGVLVDSQSLFNKNKNLSSHPYILAYPIDSLTILYYRMLAKTDSVPLEIYTKEIFQKFMKRVSGVSYELLKPVIASPLYNCARRTVSDELHLKSFLVPQQVGFASLTAGPHWWCLEKFYTFSSPLIAENNGSPIAFVPGFDFRYYPGIQKSLIEPIGVVGRESEWYSYGISLAAPSSKTTDSQVVYICDQRGNLLDTVKLFKRKLIDAVLGENEKEKMLYTVKKAGRYAFLPSIDDHGHLYYGIIDYGTASIEVRWRPYRAYKAVPCGPMLENELEYERGISFGSGTLECSQGRQVRLRLPSLLITDLNDSVRTMTEQDLTREGYCARLARISSSDLAAALKRKQSALPRPVQRLQDSLARMAAGNCPWRMFIFKKTKGVVASFYYGIADNIVAARVIAVSAGGDVFVRVDCQDRAEVVVFSDQGRFRNRFVFNRQPVAKRKDLIAVSAQGEIVEKDYEVQENGYRFLQWRLNGPVALEEKEKSSHK
jgi:hypothetical protein